MNVIATIAIGLLLVVHAAPQSIDSSKSLPTIDQVLDKYIRAIGGREANEKIKTRIATGVWDNVTRGVRFPIEIYSMVLHPGFHRKGMRMISGRLLFTWVAALVIFGGGCSNNAPVVSEGTGGGPGPLSHHSGTCP